MQLTRFDRWLREKFVYELHIQTLRPPASLPVGIRAIDLPEVPGCRYRHLYISRDSKAADQLVRVLKENNQTYDIRVLDRKAWYVRFIAPGDKSFTWWLFSTAVIIATGVAVLVFLAWLLGDPEFRHNLIDALELLKG
jgi:hypothetical protein